MHFLCQSVDQVSQQINKILNCYGDYGLTLVQMYIVLIQMTYVQTVWSFRSSKATCLIWKNMVQQIGQILNNRKVEICLNEKKVKSESVLT